MSTFAKKINRVLLTNDDGIDAPGLATLIQVAEQIAKEVWVVAPAHDQSGTSHSLSLHSPLRVAQKGPRQFAVAGTPGDCAVLAVRKLMPDAPDLILSGINRGANLGVETVFSGTVGAAMTGMLLGIPSMALSQAFSDRENVKWHTAGSLAADTILQFVGGDWSGSTCLNINFPDVEPSDAGSITLTRQGAGLLRDVQVVSGKDPRGLDYHWLNLSRCDDETDSGTETAALKSGAISVTPLQFERTNLVCLSALRDRRQF